MSDKKETGQLAKKESGGHTNSNVSTLFHDRLKSLKEASKSLVSIGRYFLGPILGIFAYFATDYLHFNVSSSNISPLLWALFAYVLAQHFEVYILSREAKKETVGLFSAMSADFDMTTGHITKQISESRDYFSGLMSHLNVSVVSDAGSIEQMSATLESARFVRNTFVNLSNLTGTRTSVSANLIKRYERFLLKGADSEWHDAVGLEDFFDGRYQQIFPTGTEATLGRHRLSILNGQSAIPVMNFLLCANNLHEFTSLYFGWIGSKANAFEVFHTKDKRIIALFNSYFDQIIDGVRVIDFIIPYNIPFQGRFAPLIISRIVGKWLSVSRSQRDKPKSGSVEYAIISIEYNKQWRLSGEIYKLSRSGREMCYRIESQTCALVKHTIYYSYYQKNEYFMTIGEGVGGYSISDLLTGGIPENLMHGFFSHMKTGKKHETFAVKTSDDELLDNDKFSNLMLAHAGIDLRAL